MSDTSSLFKIVKVLMYGFGILDKKAAFIQEEYEKGMNK